MIKFELDIERTDNVEYIIQKYDLQVEDKLNIEIPTFEIPKSKWNIGLIVGSSGSGKTTLLDHFTGKPRGLSIFNQELCIFDLIDRGNPEETSKLLTSVGLSSIPTWLKPMHALSNGEKYRFLIAKDLAYTTDDSITYVDEYTSVVNREVAKSMSNSLQKYIRREGRQMVLASCHEDIIDWLQPDWVYNTDTKELKKKVSTERPKQRIRIFRAKYDVWKLFSKHHYLTESLNKSSRIYCLEVEGVLVGCCAILSMPSGTVKNAYRLSRTVVLPDYQGMGLGKYLSDFVSKLYTWDGKRVFTKTVNPALGEYRKNSSDWKPTSKNGRITKYNIYCQDSNIKWNYFDRISYCYEFVGQYDMSNFKKLLK